MLVQSQSFEDRKNLRSDLQLGAIVAAGFATVAGETEGSTSSGRGLSLRLLRRMDDGVKRLLDFVFAGTLLAVLTPLMAAVAVLVALDGGPVFFRHRRVGRALRPFQCMKFRTMMLGAEPCLKEYLALHPQARDEWEIDHKLGADPRVTTIGKFLRRTSLDELPQLFNVLSGDMSLVGPRPITFDEVIRYGSKANLYASVRPGLTGPWQISGRNEVGYAERIGLDARYVNERNILRDFLILSATPRAVLSRRGAR